MSDFDLILKSVVEQANKFSEELVTVPPNERTPLIRDRIAKNDVVFAVWEDRSAPDGIGAMIIKGPQRLLELLRATSAARHLRVTGISIEAAEAEAMLQIAGEPDRRDRPVLHTARTRAGGDHHPADQNERTKGMERDAMNMPVLKVEAEETEPPARAAAAIPAPATETNVIAMPRRPA